VSSLVLAVCAAIASATLTAGARRLAVDRSVLDVPNERSLHLSPTPRAGGVAIAAVVLVVLAWLGWHDLLEAAVVAGLAGGVVVVTTVGWMDDLRSLPSGVRALAQLAAAAWFLWWAGGMGTLALGERTVALGPAGTALALIAIVWSINLYNFMDGIDGIAGGQAVVAGGVGAGLLAGAAPGLSFLSAAIAGASLGFLVWNWSPARIFMGDAGSGLLGFLFAALALLSERGGGPPLVSWLLFGGAFIFDATVTLIRRIVKGERWYAAHKSHAYQRAVQSGWSHAQVSSGVVALSAVLCLLGLVVARRPDLMLLCVGGGVALLLACYLWIERRLPMRAGIGRP
jgi:Fuc2NAc and GlcNAc transferase